MRNKMAVFFFIILCTKVATAQDQSNLKRLDYVIVPSESVLLVAASQPDCPIEIAGSKLLNAVDGSREAAFQYELRNRGTKPIKYVSVWALNTDGTGGGPLLNGHSFVVPLMPGKKTLVGEPSGRIVGLSPELKERLKLAGPMRVIVVLVVAKVEYADGSAFSDMKTVKALTDYFVDINSEAIDSRARGITVSKRPNP
jgi:hypothetical protein